MMEIICGLKERSTITYNIKNNGTHAGGNLC
jgi:hypothetical protein